MSRQPLYYTFGNHMHWVDMQWLWGYHVLPGCVRDMIHLCREAGVKGCVNFDGIGYEKLAAEDPEALAELKAAVQEGLIEPVGCSYGQPYGLFQGGESNVRQLIYGTRAVRRLLGVWPKTFWEEEFYFFPQLPQMLAGCGFTGASLFFQWTWHTPEVPKEESPVIWWEGLDGTQILTATRNALNMHQWPEDMDAVLSGIGVSPMASSGVSPELIQQWLELMPSPDWMCRSQLILPKLKELLADERFEILPVTLGEYLSRSKGEGAPVRRYTMDQVWHGLTLGKNGDDMRYRSAKAEGTLQLAETLSAIAGVFGRPYPQWDVYPVWELEEAWRELLAAQHHDNDECEGLCARVGKRQYERAEGLANDVIENASRRLFNGHPSDRVYAAFNPHGWRVHDRSGKRTVKPFSLVDRGESWDPGGLSLGFEEGTSVVTHGRSDRDIEATVDLARAGITRLRRRGGPDLALEDQPIAKLHVGETPVELNFSGGYDEDGQYVMASYGLGEDEVHLVIDRAGPHHGIDLDYTFFGVSPLVNLVSPGFAGAMTMEVPLPWPDARVFADTPYGVQEVGTGASGVRKYPKGDWMTSPQWFEQVQGAFSSHAMVDIVDPKTGEGLLIAHKGSRQWFRRDGALRCVLSAEDPWDGSFYRDNQLSYDGEGNRWSGDGAFRFHPHGPIDHAERWKVGQEFLRRKIIGIEGPIELFTFADVDPHHVVISALYREAEDFSGKHLDDYAGVGMGYPYVLRLVELNGEPADVELTIVGPVAKAYKTNMLGQIEGEICPTPQPRPRQSGEGEPGFQYDTLRFPMRPHEIATLYLDIVPGRKQTRDLDAKREIWATVHRVD